MSANEYKLLQTDLYNAKINANAFIFSEPKKLTWSVSTSQFAVPVFRQELGFLLAVYRLSPEEVRPLAGAL